MASLSCIFLVLISAFGLITGIPVTKVTTKTKVTSPAGHVTTHETFPYIFNVPHSYHPQTDLTSMTQAHYPYIYGATGPSNHLSPAITTHHTTHYPYVYGWGQSVSQMPNYHANPYPYMYGWSSPFSHVMPNYGSPFGYPPGLYRSGYSGYY